MSTNDNGVPLLHVGSSKMAGRQGQPWQEDFWRRAPWLALLALLGFLGCCVGMVVVLVESDGKPVATWPAAFTGGKVSVSVLLSLLASLGNLFLSVALSRGYEISWWLQAIRGAELRRLQFDLSVQTNIAILCSRRFAITPFSVAALICLIVGLLDGPLIQQASDTELKTHSVDAVQLSVPVTEGLLPVDFSGYGGAQGGTVDALMPVFGQVYHDYASRTAMELNVAGCGLNTTCRFVLPASGFDVNCTSQTVPYDFTALAAGVPTNNNITAFAVSFAFPHSEAAGYNEIDFTARYKPDPACQGSMIERQCRLVLATVNYTVNITDEVVTLDGWVEGRNDTLARPTAYDGGVSAGGYGVTYSGGVSGYYVSMLGGVYTALNSLYASTLNLRLSVMTMVPYIMSGTSIVASNYLTTDRESYSNCSMAWSDPTADIINTARELMLRSVIAYSQQLSNNSATAATTTAAAATAATTAATANPTQTISGARVTKVLASYRSHYGYLVGTLVAMAVQAAVIVYLLLGWQRLGRKVTLDGFELARALGAPLLLQGGSSSNSELDDGLKPLLRQPLRYGEISEDAAASWAAVGAAVRESVANFQQNGGEQGTWLALDYAARVRPIRKNVPY